MYSYTNILDHNSLQFILLSTYNLKEQASEWEFTHLHRTSDPSKEDIPLTSTINLIYPTK